jgi:hypothetical protein
MSSHSGGLIVELGLLQISPCMIIEVGVKEIRL